MARLLPILWLLASCGGDGGGLSPDAPLAELSDDEVGDLCTQLIDTYEKEVDFAGLCTFGVLLASSGQSEPIDAQECSLQVLLCANLLRDQLLDPEACAENLAGQLTDCDATVGGLQECIDFTLETTGAALDGLTCEAAGDPEALVGQLTAIEASVAEAPPGCVAVLSCSGLGQLGL